MPVAPSFCSRCGAVVEDSNGCDPRDELAELDALLEHLNLNRDYLKRKINQIHSPIEPTFCSHCRDAVEKGCDPWNELHATDALSERLKLKGYDLKRKINQLHSLVIRQLAPDVMSTIFEFCLPDFTDNKRSPYTENLSTPLSLGAICSHWREIAWSTPSLWSSLVVHVTRNHDSHIGTGIVREWLSRSGQLPLSIRILSPGFQPKEVSALANIINQYSNRWSNLDLFLDLNDYQNFETDIHAPILKSIRLHSDVRYEITDPKFQLTCPWLERVSLSSFSSSIKGINIHWDNLTHLTLHSMSIYNSFLILRKTPRLVYCKVSGSSGWFRRGSVGASLLTSLRYLQLLIPRYAECFLDNLKAPFLEEFCFPRSRIWSMEVINSFLERSACSLRSLSVMFSTFPPYFDGFMSLLQSMPSLNTLSLTTRTMSKNTYLSEDYNPRNILQLLAKILSSQSASLQQGFLPNLEILEYSGKLHLRPGNYDDLYHLPPADNAVHGPLHLLKLDLRPATRIPKNMISYISSLVERGVAVNVLSKSEDILQSSINYYGFREDSLCWDWADNLDSSLFS